MTKNTKPPKSKLLRMAAKDIEHILYELDAWERGERSTKLTWKILENASGFSRQALWAKAEIKNRFNSVKEVIRNGSHKPRPNEYHKTLEHRIKSLEEENTNLVRQKNKWLELWARYEYNCSVLGLDTQQLSKPLPPLNRT